MRGMKILFLTLGFCYSALAFKLDCHDWQAVLDSRVMRKLNDISYFGLKSWADIIRLVNMQVRRQF